VSLNKDENYVFIYEEKSKTVKKQKVLIGKLTSRGVEIKSGLLPRPGDRYSRCRFSK